MTVSPTRTGWINVGWTDTGWTDVSWTDVSWTDVNWTDVSWTDVSWTDVGAVIRTEPTQRGQRRREGSGVGSGLNPCSMLPIARMTGPLERLGAACG